MITRVHGSRPHLCGIAAHKKYGSTEVKSRLVLKSFVSVTTPMFFFFLAKKTSHRVKGKKHTCCTCSAVLRIWTLIS